MQKIVHPENGDCMRACLTSMMGLPNDPKKIPLPGAVDFFLPCYRFLRRFGMHIRYEQKAFWGHGYWMASVKSKNYPEGTHAIVMNGHKVAHDPSTKRRYRAGTSLLGKDIVVGGFVLEVIDATKLKNLEVFRKKLCANEK